MGVIAVWKKGRKRETTEKNSNSPTQGQKRFFFRKREKFYCVQQSLCRVGRRGANAAAAAAAAAAGGGREENGNSF